MARIPIYSQQTTPSGQLEVRPIEPDVSSGLQSLGRVVGAIGQDLAAKEQAKKLETDKLEIAKRTSQAELDLTSKLDELKNNYQPGADNYPEQVFGAIDEYQKTATQGLQTREGEQAMRARLDDMRSSLGRQAIGWQSQETARHKIAGLDQVRENYKRAVLGSPGEAQRFAASYKEAVDSLQLAPEYKRDATVQAMQEIAWTAERAIADQNPNASFKQGSRWSFDSLPAERQQQLIDYAQQQHQRLAERGEMIALRREVAAGRVLDQMDKQAASGIPATPEDQLRWQDALRGTSLAPEYNTRIEQMNEVQGLLRQPIDVQVQYLEQKRQQMATEGASLTEQANIKRLEGAVEQNVKMLREQPLAFNALRTGESIPPLDLAAIDTPGQQQQFSDQLAQRFDTVNALRTQYGPEVARNPWRPEEAAQLKAYVAQADDKSKLQLLSALAAASPSGSDYLAALKPLAADSPATMLAGLAQFRGLKGEDGTDVPQVLLAGSKVLADKSVSMPSEERFREEFDSSVGMALVPGTPQREQAYLAYKSLYAGMAGPDGVTHGPQAEVVNKLSKKALALATGGIAVRAGTKVIKPYGLSDKLFDQIVDIELQGLATRSGLALDQLEDMPLTPAVDARGKPIQDAYFLMNGTRAQLDPQTQQPLIVRIK
jgi:hypothetical protein